MHTTLFLMLYVYIYVYIYIHILCICIYMYWWCLSTLVFRSHKLLEFFIEGGRSRTGLMLPPKMGLMSWALEELFTGGCTDIMLVGCCGPHLSITESL